MTTASAPGVILGTAAYMAPEQARGRAVDKRADIWAFGCLLYEMLTGVRPFDGDDVTEILGATIHKEPEWNRLPERARPLVPVIWKKIQLVVYETSAMRCLWWISRRVPRPKRNARRCWAGWVGRPPLCLHSWRSPFPKPTFWRSRRRLVL
jgi:serine/threonine protein kinase